MRDFVGYLPKFFISFRRLEKQFMLQERRLSEESQQLVISSPGAVAETIENPETDTSPAKTMTVLQSAQLGIDIRERVSHKNIDPVGSVQSRRNSDENAYCEDKLRCSSEDETQTLAEVSEELIAQVLGGPSSFLEAANVFGGHS